MRGVLLTGNLRVIYGWFRLSLRVRTSSSSALNRRLVVVGCCQHNEFELVHENLPTLLGHTRNVRVT